MDISINIEILLDNLVKNNMYAVFVEDREHARLEVERLIRKGSSIAFGGSVTLNECGITHMMENGDYVICDRSDKTAFFNADYMLTSANAITQDGILYNVDGASNRVAGICYGPKKVIVVAGINKLVKDIDQAVLRLKHISAPKNCVRLNRNTPCARTGKCISDDINKGCDSADRICCNYLISAKQREKDRISVIIVNEELGF
jgi:L-lactate utilization protein LutB